MVQRRIKLSMQLTEYFSHYLHNYVDKIHSEVSNLS